MTRKRRKNSPISLFAFQDVMASVIGILFFVVLLMSLDIVKKATESYDNGLKYETSEEKLNAQILVLNNRRQEILKEIKFLENQIIIISTKDEQDILDDITQYEKNLKALYSHLEQDQISKSEMLDKLDKNRKLYSNKVRQYDKSNRRIFELKDHLAEQISKPSLSYIIDGKLDMTPWLVELTSNNIRIASHDMKTIFEFDAFGQNTRERLFISWAKTRNNQYDYFVFLIKPSGFNLFKDTLKENIIQLGFDIGTDLVPEDKRVF
jgi:hypothetical protein